MAVSITWSATNGGTSYGSILDLGSVSHGSAGSSFPIYLRHDGSNKITNVGIYVREFTGTYTGFATAAKDFVEIKSWAVGATSDAWGGFQYSFDKSTWPTFASPSASNTGLVKTGTGDSEVNAIDLPTATGVSVIGEIDPGSAPNVSFYARIVVPADEDQAGLRQVDQVIRYSYTS